MHIHDVKAFHGRYGKNDENPTDAISDTAGTGFNDASLLCLQQSVCNDASAPSNLDLKSVFLFLFPPFFRRIY